MATGDNGAFPAVDASKELNLGVPEQFPVDPVSSSVATARDLKEGGGGKEGDQAAKGKKCRCPFSGTSLKSAMVVTGVVVVAVGVAFIVTKKLKKA